MKSLEELERELNTAWAALQVAAHKNAGTRAEYVAAEERLNQAEREYRRAYRQLLEEAS